MFLEMLYLPQVLAHFELDGHIERSVSSDKTSDLTGLTQGELYCKGIACRHNLTEVVTGSMLQFSNSRRLVQ